MWLLVSFSIPSLMLWSYGTTGTELRVPLERHDALTLLEHSRYYHQYIQENLLGQVLTDPAEDVGLPITDEIMEEQTDTRRTETEITDQETKHASHTQHTMPARGKVSMSITFDDVSLLDRLMYYWAPKVQTPVE